MNEHICCILWFNWYNFYISLGIIAIALFSFLSYGLYKGIDLEDDYPKLKGFDFKKKISKLAKFDNSPDFDFDMGEGIDGIIIAIVI